MQMNVDEKRSRKGWLREQQIVCWIWTKNQEQQGRHGKNARDRHELNMISVVCLHLIRCMFARVCVYLNNKLNL